MLKITSNLFIALLFLGACSTSSKSAAPGTAASNFSSSTSAMRAPSSIEDYEGVNDATTKQDEKKLKAAFSASDKKVFEAAKADVKKRMSQILKRSAAAVALMNDFDKELDTFVDPSGNKIAGKTFDLDQSLTYRKLQRTRTLVEAVEARMADEYVYMWKLFLDPAKQGVSKPRVARTKERAKAMLTFVHAEANLYVSDIRVVGLLRMQNHLAEISMDLASDVSATEPLYVELQNIIAKLQNNENDASTLSYNDFIDAMKDTRDSEYDKEMRPDRIPQGSILVAGFKNTTGSEFGPNVWALTFDDGPHKDNTKAIAQALADQGVKGSYFWLSKLVKTYPTIANDIYTAGYPIASHSVDHSDLTKLSGSKLTAQVGGSRDTIESEIHAKGGTGYTMKDFRCPYGACWAPKSKAVQQAIFDANLRHVYWTVDSLDWQDKNADSVFARVLKQMKAAGHGVILFHDIHPRAAKVLPMLFKDKYCTAAATKCDFRGL